MMGSGQFRRFEAAGGLVLLVVALLSGCVAPKPQSSEEVAPQAVASPRVPPEFPAELSATEAIDGSLILLTVTPPKALEGTRPSAEFEGVNLPFFEVDSASGKSYQAVFGVPFAHKPGLVMVKVKLGEKTADLPLTIKDGGYPSESIKVSNRHVNPSKKDMVKIKKDLAEVGAIYRNETAEKHWSGPFALPVDSVITSRYGTKRVFNGETKSYHGGLDFRAPVGTPIHAPAAGVVALAKFLFFTGNTVILDHGFGVVTIYAHLSKLKVKAGQKVAPKTLLGLSGMTGRASGPHLHWQAVVHKVKVNPLDLTQVLR